MAMLRSPCSIIVENAALLLKTISTFHPPTATRIREFSLSSGILLHHFYCSIFSSTEGHRFLSRYLVGLWMTGPNDCSEKQLLKRMLPSGFLPYLSMPLLSEMELDNLDEMERSGMEAVDNFGRIAVATKDDHLADGWGESGGSGTNTKRMSRRIQISNSVKASVYSRDSNGNNHVSHPQENFRILFHMLTKDHSLPDLIWNQQTRRQLRITLETELNALEREIDMRGGYEFMAWNHQQFMIEYPSLRDEVKVGTVYMRLWIQAGNAFIKQWEEPERLFELLFRRLLCDIDRDTNVSLILMLLINFTRFFS